MSKYISVIKHFSILRSKKTKKSRTIWKKIAHTELSGENLSMAKNSTCYVHINWLLINSTANVVQSNFLSHNAVVNLSKSGLKITHSQGTC